MGAAAEAYVDTSAFIAFLDRSDSHHALFRRLFAEPPRLLTSTLVVAEGHGWFVHRYGSHQGLRFLALIEDLRPLKILGVGLVEVREGTNVLRKLADQILTLTDAVGLHLMSKHRVKSCWSTDFHLGLTGVPLVIHGA